MAVALRMDVWSDYVCPFCYLEVPVLERVSREYGDEVEIVWRAFEFRPEPAPTLDPDAQYLHTVWGESVYPMAENRGMTLRLPPVQPRSRRALELAELARQSGRFDQVHKEIFRTFFEDGRDLNDAEVLVRIGEDSGLDPEATRQALSTGQLIEKVLADEREAAELGISGVPALVVRPRSDSSHGAADLSGAQPFELVKATIDRLRRNA